MNKFFSLFPQKTLDIEIFYILSNIWWFIAFAIPNYFNGVIYVRALTYIGKSDLLLLLSLIIITECIALIARKYSHISLIVSPTMFLYLGTMGFLGDTITFTAVIFYLITLYGALRLFAFTYYNNVHGTKT